MPMTGKFSLLDAPHALVKRRWKALMLKDTCLTPVPKFRLKGIMIKRKIKLVKRNLRSKSSASLTISKRALSIDLRAMNEVD